MMLQLVKPFGFSLTVNGRAGARSLAVTTGQHLAMEVEVIIPAHARVENLWLGISSGADSMSKDGPRGLDPLLSHSHGALRPGKHTIKFSWNVPTTMSPRSVSLTAVYAGMLPVAAPAGAPVRLTEASVSHPVAEFVVS